MKPLSETLTEMGIDFSLPIEIKNTKGNETYYEDSSGYWEKYEWDDNGRAIDYEDSSGYWERYKRDAEGRPTYHENSDDYWQKWERDANGDVYYYEDSTGVKKGTTQRAQLDALGDKIKDAGLDSADYTG